MIIAGDQYVYVIHAPVNSTRSELNATGQKGRQQPTACIYTYLSTAGPIVTGTPTTSVKTALAF